MGFRGKQIATLTLVAGVVALATSVMNAAALARLSVLEMRERAELLSETLYHLTGGVVRSYRGDDLEGALRTAPELRSFAEAVVGYAPTTLYVAIVDREGVALLHHDPVRQGKPLPRAGSLVAFSAKGPLSLLAELASGHDVLEIELPFDVNGRPFGAVRVAVSTLLLREELSGAIATNALTAAAVVLVAFAASFYLANRLLAPIEMLRRELAQIDPGEGSPPLDLKSEADISRIAEFFSSVSRRLSEDRQLREAGKTWLETMLGGLADAVVVVGRERQILSLNLSAVRLLGQGRAELPGKLLSDVLPDGHPLVSLVDDALARGDAVGPRSAPLAVEGREVLHTLSAHVLREAGVTSGVMVIVRDMEKLSRLGSHLSYSQKLSALGRLTSGVAHEIKNPLNAIVIHVALLRQKFAGGRPEAGKYLDVLDQEIRRLDRVIQGFLKFTRPEDLRLDSVPLKELIDGVVGLLRAEADLGGVRIVTDLALELPLVLGDRELLQQAFVNLMLNACQAMPSGGVLTIRALGSGNGHVSIDFQDTGVGIPEEALPKIFDLYYTTKERGSGIGLSMVYRIVQLHDGEITVSSTPGEGTRFRIELPEVAA